MTMRILIADDEKLILDDMKRDVEELLPDATVDAANGPEEALTLAGKSEYDVAILDIDMPGMDGISLARKLISAHPAINIIFATGYTEYAIEAHELYCSAFLLKPIGVRQFKTAFENLRKPFIDIPTDFYAQHYSGGDVLGKRLEMFREQRGLSRQDLADLMGVTRQTVFRWEHGERIPDVLTFVRLTRILGVEINDILDLPEE